MVRLTRNVFLILTVSLFLFYGYGFCANSGQADEPGSQAERFKSGVEERRKALEGKKEKVSGAEVMPEKEKPAVRMPSFVLKQIDIAGVTVFKPEDFTALSDIQRAYVGREITFNDVEAMMATIKAFYKKRGYFTAIVYIPEQEIKDGRLVIKVVEGVMGKLKIEGNRWVSESRLRRSFHIKENEPLDFKKLQKDIIRLNQNSDVEVRAIIAAGQTPGSSDIILKVTDSFPWHIGAGVDNQGTRLIGRVRSFVTVRSSDVSGLGDTFFMSTLFSTSATGEYFGYTIPLDTTGTRFGIDITNFNLKLGKELKAADIKGVSQIYSPYIVRELYLSEDSSVDFTAGLDIKTIKRKTEGNLESYDQLRIPFFGFNLKKIDSFLGGGETRFDPRFNFGTEGFLDGTSRGNPLAGRHDAGGFFFKYEQFLRRTQKMAFDSYMVIRSRLQLASHTLPSSEQLQLGGSDSVRGYPEGDYLADMGGTASFEWIFPTYFIPASWKLSGAKVPLRHQIEPIIFLDMGGGRLKTVLPGEERDKFLLGIGGGFRVRLHDNIFLRCEWAGHFGDDPVSGAGPSTFRFAFQTEY